MSAIRVANLKYTGLDVGCAKLIREGKVKVKQGVEAARFTEDSLVFTDGSSLPADVVNYAYVPFIYTSAHPPI